MFKKIACLLICIFIYAIPAFADNSKDIQRKENFEIQRNQQKMLIYKELELNNEQIKNAISIDNKYKPLKRSAIKKFYEEYKILKKMQADKDNVVNITWQKAKIKREYRRAKKYFMLAQKEFEAILTKTQYEKYTKLQQVRKNKLSNKKLIIKEIDK